MEDDIKLFANVGTAIGENADAYAFGNRAERQVEGGFYYRNPHGRIGVFRGDPLADGTPTVKVADLTGTGSGNCPALTVVDNRVDPAALAAIRNNPNCCSLIERFPGGFTPQYGAHIGDWSLTAGVRGNASNGWRWDASAGIGRNSASFYIPNTVDGKVTARFRLSDNFALRGAASTGFRVPTAGQANLRNVLTSFRSVDGVRRLVDIAILPPTSPVAERKGAKPLTPEQSRNITAGVVFNVGGLDVTVDYYNIEVTDRISLTSAFALTQADVDALLAAGVQDAQSIREVRFFSNEQTVKFPAWIWLPAGLSISPPAAPSSRWPPTSRTST